MNTSAPSTKTLTIKEQAEKDRQEAIASLRKMLKPGDTVRTILRHRSSSGMFRVITLAIIGKDHNGKPDIFCIDGKVCEILGYKYNTKHDGVPVSGCGMDMGFHLVYNLGRALFPKGFILPKGKSGRNGDTSGRDNDGGYALNHRWL